MRSRIFDACSSSWNRVSINFQHFCIYRIRRCISHPSGVVFQARLLDNQEGANTERYVFGKLSARCFQPRACWHRHHSNCGDIEHGKSAPGGCNIHRPIRYPCSKQGGHATVGGRPSVPFGLTGAPPPNSFGISLLYIFFRHEEYAYRTR